MKKVFLSVLLLGGLTSVANAQNKEVNTGDVLTGDAKLACEALLCLPSAVRPSECTPSIQRYFSIRKKKWKNTLNARKAFLNLCPTSNHFEKTAMLLV